MESSDTVIQRTRRNILVVDDDELMRRTLQRLLMLQRHYDVRCLADGALVMDEIRQWRPHLIVLDTRMTGKDGLTVCREIRQDARLDEIRIIVLSGALDQDLEHVVLAAGADAYFEKPFDSQALLSAIRNLVFPDNPDRPPATAE